MLNDLAQKIKSQKLFKKENFLLFFWPFQFLIIGLVIGYFVSRITVNRSHDVVGEVHQFQAEYPFINSLMACDFSEQKTLRSFKDKISDHIRKNKDRRIISHASVIFRDLKKGDWFGIEENSEFSPGSLLKVPVMMAVLKDAENNPEILKEKIYFDGSREREIRSIIPSAILERGEYTVEELVKIMIFYSDNNATVLLLDHIGGDERMSKFFRDVGINFNGDRKTDEDVFSVREYSSFFRVLYNASYLNREMSNKALEILSQTEFKDGLLAKIPNNLTVSHKFGERGTVENVQLHDCGIVYYPERPYLLCVMTRGQDMDSLKEVIQDISFMVYSEVSKSTYK